MIASLPPAPESALDPGGRPRLGAYHGGLERIDLRPLAGEGLRGRWRALTALKRWHHALVATDELLITMAVVDAGYAASGFAFALDRAAGTVLLDRTLLGPAGAARVNERPGVGARATLELRAGALHVERRNDRWQLLADLGRAGRIEVTLDPAGAPAPLSLVAALGRGAVNVTQKTCALRAAGELRVPGRRFAVDGLGCLDYTAGLLPHAVRWRWAHAVGRGDDGAPLAVNLVEGFNAASPGEDALFVGAGPRPLPRSTFRFDRSRPLAPWRIASDDGTVALTFTPLAVHAERRNLGLVRSRFLQLAGTFDGSVATQGATRRLVGVPGVCEDQDLRW